MSSSKETPTKELETHLSKAQEYLQNSDPLQAVKELFFAGAVMSKSTEFGKELESKSLALQKIVQSAATKDSIEVSQDIEQIKKEFVTTSNDPSEGKT